MTYPTYDGKPSRGYVPYPGDAPPQPGEMAREAARRLARRPDQMAALEVFVEMWGMDCYDPFSAEGASTNVLQIIRCILIDARAALSGEKG